jgi:predicted DNA-binding transcriptional regulator AlpA
MNAPQPIRYDSTVGDITTLPDLALLTPKQLAQVTGLALPTIKRWAALGKGPKITRIEGLPRYVARDVRAWIERSAA